MQESGIKEAYKVMLKIAIEIINNRKDPIQQVESTNNFCENQIPVEKVSLNKGE